MLTEEHDSGADGSIENRLMWAYDSDGNMLTYEEDRAPMEP